MDKASYRDMQLSKKSDNKQVLHPRAAAAALTTQCSLYGL